MLALIGQAGNQAAVAVQDHAHFNGSWSHEVFDFDTVEEAAEFAFRRLAELTADGADVRICDFDELA
jgi:hypothetical protein